MNLYSTSIWWKRMNTQRTLIYMQFLCQNASLNLSQKFFYMPFIEKNKSFKWNAAARDDLKDYNLDDLSI